MFGDLLELTTTLVNPDYTPEISDLTTPSSSTAHAPNDTMARTKQLSKPTSASSFADANGVYSSPMPASTVSAPATRTRARSTASPSEPAIVSPPAAGQPRRISKIPSTIQFIVVVILSFALESLLQSVVSQFGVGDLAAISKHSESWEEIAGLLGWKVTQLALYWFGNFDGKSHPLFVQEAH